MVARNISLALAVKELHEGTTTERLMLMMCICGRIYIWAAYILIMMIDDNYMLYLSRDTLSPFAYHTSIKRIVAPTTLNQQLGHTGARTPWLREQHDYSKREKGAVRDCPHAQLVEEDVTDQSALVPILLRVMER